MERVIVNEGTKVNLYNLFEDLQNYSQTNDINTLGQMIGTFGVNALMVSGIIDPSDTAFKVTNYSAGVVAIGAGEGLTEAFNYLYLASPGTTQNVDSLGDGWHTLYVKHNQTYNTPVDIMSGFAYGISGIAQRNSRAHDGITFQWDTDPGVSGIVLADVNIYSGYVTGDIEDRRQENVLQFSNKAIPGYHIQNTDTGTTSATFAVGGALVNGAIVGGSLVELVPIPPLPPPNVRIVDVWPSTVSSVRRKSFDSQLCAEVRTGLITHEASVSIKFGYDNIIGWGQGASSHNIQFMDLLVAVGIKPAIAENSLAGYYIYAPKLSLSWLIGSNTASNSSGRVVLTTTPVTGHSQYIGQYTFGPGDWIIHSNAEAYEIVVTPVTETGELVPSERYEETVMQPTSGAPVLQKTMDLFIGEQVEIKARAIHGSQKSAYTVMEMGAYSKQAPFITQQNYTVPYLVQLPGIDSTGASVGATPTSNGFLINITPGVWANIATDYELCWTTDAAGANFSNPAHEKRVVSQTSYDVSTSSQQQYFIAVRPLMAGQAVAAAKTCSTQSGSAGTLPQDTTLVIPANLLSFSGVIGAYQAGTQSWTVTSLYSPASQTTWQMNVLDPRLPGARLIVDGFPSYELTALDSTASTWIITEVGTGDVVTSGLAGKAFSAATTMDTRSIYFSPGCRTNMQVVKVHVDQQTKNGLTNGSPVLRWYAYGYTRDADSLVLNLAGNTEYTQETNVIIPVGGRLVVDMWDESLNDNVTGFKGTINVVWRTYTGAFTSR